MTSQHPGEPRWHVSSWCNNGSCVAVADLSDGQVAITDTKVSDGPILTFTPTEWDDFIKGVKAGEFDQFGLPQV